jgi:hypothetical protein
MKKHFCKWTIHVEAIHNDEVFKKLKNIVIHKKPICFVITPVNYEFIKTNIGTSLQRKKLEKILKDRYLFLKKYTQLQLHVHLNILCNLNYREQQKIILSAYKWFEKNLGFKPTMFVPGWWRYDKNTEIICKRLNLKLVKSTDYFFIHDYEL